MAITQRTLGKSGLSLSEIGLGCWQFGGDFGPIEDRQSKAVLKAATEAGVTFFDTADVYGNGRSEWVVGEHVASNPAIVATKVGRSGKLYPNKFSFEGVRDSLIASRKRLGVEAIDLAQLHCVPTELLRDGKIFESMNRIQDEGIIRHWGASVETLDEARICLEQDRLTSLQIIFNLFRQDASWELFAAAKGSEVGIIVRLPLASGLLTGKFAVDHKFPESDHRNYNADGAAFSVGETFSGLPFKRGVELTHQLSRFVPEEYSLAEFSLRWILDFPEVTTVIAGCSSPDQVIDNAAVSAMPPLTSEQHDAVEYLYESEVRPSIRGEV